MSLTGAARPTRGRAPRALRRALLAAGAVAALVVAYLVFLAVRGDAVDVGTRGYRLEDRQAVLTFEVHKPADRVADCVARAQDERGDVVGRASAVAPAGQATSVLTVAVPTPARATAVEVESCVLRR